MDSPSKQDIEPMPKLSFDNTEIAYAHQTNGQLLQTYYLYRLMAMPWLVKAGSATINQFLKLHIPINRLIKKTIYKQFCGGETLEDTIPLINSLKASNIEVLLNYSVEGLSNRESYKNTYEVTLKSIQFSKEYPSIRAICLKFTGLANVTIWTKLQDNQPLTEKEELEYKEALHYIHELCKSAVESDVQLFIDAEETWFQNSIDAVVDEMMSIYNKEQAYIFNTYQLYRSDKLQDLKKSIEKAKNEGYILGAKLVRGAYVEKENEYAQDHHLQSKINPNKPATDKEFNDAVAYSVDHIEHISICCATHNEESTLLFVNKLVEKNIPLNHPHVNASQLLGMSDNITYNLANYHVNTAKYVPYGPVKEVVPYLIRRAEENTSVEGQTTRELSLVKREINRRNIRVYI